MIVVSLLAGPLAAAEPAVRVAVVHGAELLPSESKALAELEKKIAKRNLGMVRFGDANPAESEAARKLMAREKTALPAEWQSLKVVVVLEVLPPSGEKPKRLTRGLGAVMMVRPPRVEPIYLERIDGTVETWLSSNLLDEWIAHAIAVATRTP